ncbi:MAG: alanine--tRNA ligase, partial [Planctomycetota bacterium]|jgi:alanyl-tRNA synthetase
MRTDEIRSAYLNFFKERGHKICSSDSLVPSDDPTLLFTGAGMNQFKNQFMNIGKIDFRRAATAQKCIRTGDIMNVGVTPSHHTFFEMMGNFSFGDYFKKEAVTWAWEFLTGALKIDEKLLQVSVYKDDNEAFDIWKNEIGLPENRITRLGDHDNFWPADAPKLGPNGPCGPCSEIFFDRGEQFGCGSENCDITCDCRRYVEIWNLVFTQFDRQEDGSLPPLPQKNIDTGMGLERMAACMQGVETNMDIDIFKPILGKLEDLSGKKYKADKASDTLMKRIADHARAVTFCIADGVLPANTHRGYVLKRLLRRAVLDGRTLGIEDAFLHKTVEAVGEAMGSQYPEIVKSNENIADTVKMEEDKFLSTLSRGLNLIDMAVSKTKTENRTVIDGQTAFELYDTYGFPYELAEEVVERDGMTLDREGFEEAMSEAREKARQGAKMKGDIFAKGPMLEIKKLTEETTFTGYESLECKSEVLAIVKDNNLAESAETGDKIDLVLDKTSFYAESGGQVGDTGIIAGAGNLVIEIDDTQKIDNIFVHSGTVISGSIKKEMEINCSVNKDRRHNITRNHTSTHLLHWALREVAGEKAEQKGSWVGPDRARFDFQHKSALKESELEKIEELVNQKIIENSSVAKEELSIEAAKEKGAIALFGEKYGDTVRLVSVGNFSKELCGGCHISQTGEIGLFRIVSEESVAAGIRRIEACTGMTAWKASKNEYRMLNDIAGRLKSSVKEAPEKISSLLEEGKKMRKELADFKKGDLAGTITESIKNAKEVSGIPCLSINLGDIDGKELRNASDIVRKSFSSGVALLGGASDGKVSLLCVSSKDMIEKGLKAGDVIKKAAEIVGGSGGGRPDMAQAGGKNPEKLDDALNALADIIEELT